MSSKDYNLYSPFLPEPIEMDQFTFHLDPTLSLGVPLDSSESESSTKLTLNLSLSYLLLNSRSSSSPFEILTRPWTLLGVGAGAVTILGWYQGWWKWLFGGPLFTKVVSLDKLKPNPMDEFVTIGPSHNALHAARDYIIKYGTIKEPIIVRKVGDFYEIVNGHHRWLAAIQAGLKYIPIKVIE